jgi:hypothetical protein
MMGDFLKLFKDEFVAVEISKEFGRPTLTIDTFLK